MIGSGNVTVDECIRYLNDLVALDRDAIGSLCEHRVKANAALCYHPTVRTAPCEDGSRSVGLLGILNGLFDIGTDRGPITARFGVDDKLEKFFRTEET